MQFVILSASYLFVLIMLMPSKNWSGASIYKGELGNRHLRPIRYFVYITVYLTTLVAFVLSARGFYLGELAFQIVCVSLLEGMVHFRLARQARAERVARTQQRAPQPGAVTILSPAELEVLERQRIAEFVASGCIDDILELCAQNIEAGMAGQSFRIPRWLTRDEYNAMHSTMKEKEWLTEYTVFAQFTGRPSLVVSRMITRPQTREADRQ